MNNVISLDGEWEFKQAGAGPRVRGWQSGVVPGTVHTDLLAASLIEDPFYRCNEAELLWVEQADWIYRRTFEVPRAQLEGLRAARLVFEGLDTFATIRLNGHEVGRADNMFHPWRYEVLKHLRAGRNTIEVVFRSARQVAEERAAVSKVQYRSSFFEPRVFIRKAQYSGGWDWGPRLMTCGVWRPVRLVLIRQAQITNVCVRTRSLTARKAVEQVDVEVESLAAGLAKLRVAMVCPAGKVHEQLVSVRLKKGLQTVQAVVTIPEPRRWWPAGMGEQALYDVQVVIEADDEPLDVYQDRVGLRTVELVRKKDGRGESFAFRVNGRSVFCKGANWVPPDSFLPRFTPELYRQRVADARQAHMNMLRVWGGGIYESPAFYRACDELGLMVWQDFMFACAEYPEDRPLLKSIEREAGEAVRRLRNHPSVVLWCGNNENQWGYDAWWPPRPKRYGEVIYDRVLPNVCRSLDPDRPYWPGSPYGGPMANSPDSGDQHEWSVWIFWGNPEKYLQNKARFVSEFGFQAMPTRRTVSEFTAPADRYLFSRVLDAHNKCEDGHARNLKFLAHGYGVPRDLDEYVYLSQVSQADAIKLAVEHWRRRWPATTGALYWQHNDCWPVASWSAVDSQGRRKGLWYATRRFFAPSLVSFRPAGDNPYGLKDLDVWVTHDGAEELRGEVELAAWTVEGELLGRRVQRCRVPADGSCKVALCRPAEWGISDPDRVVVQARLSSGGRVLSTNVHSFAPPKYVEWPNARLQVAVKAQEEHLAIEVTSAQVVRAVCLTVDRWDGHFSDNFFDLTPGQRHRVRWRSTGKMPSVAEFQRELHVQTLASPTRRRVELK